MIHLTTGLRAAGLTLAAIALVGCGHYHHEKSAARGYELAFDEPRELDAKTLTSPVSVQAKPDGDGGFKFKFAGRFVDKQGNIDLSTGAPKGKRIAIQFRLRGKTPKDFTFQRNGREAIFIIKKEDFLGGARKAPFQGEEFSDFTVSEDGKSLTVFDLNDNGTTYVYQLNFLSGGKPVSFDPEIKNGDGN